VITLPAGGASAAHSERAASAAQRKHRQPLITYGTPSARGPFANGRGFWFLAVKLLNAREKEVTTIHLPEGNVKSGPPGDDRNPESARK